MEEITELTGPDSKKFSRSQKPLCLSNIAVPILKIIRKANAKSFSEIADSFLQYLTENGADVSNEKTIRRRVYDVLNVLMAADIIVKDENKQVRITHGENDPNDHEEDKEEQEEQKPLPVVDPEEEQRIEEKKKKLIVSARLLIYYRLLVERNKKLLRPVTNVQMPSIIIGYTDVKNGRIERSLNGKEMVIHSTKCPHFYSPQNIFNCMEFPKQMQIEKLKEISYLRPIEGEIEELINRD